MADDYVRETLRTLRERTGDAYVPLSEVGPELRRLHAELTRDGRTLGIRDYFDAVEAALLRRWGPGPRCERCGDTGHVGDEWCSCAAADARAKLVEGRLPLTPEAIRERMEAARG